MGLHCTDSVLVRACGVLRGLWAESSLQVQHVAALQLHVQHKLLLQQARTAAGLPPCGDGWLAYLCLRTAWASYDLSATQFVHCGTCFCLFVSSTVGMSCVLLERQQLKQLLQCVAVCQQWNTCCRSVLHTTNVQQWHTCWPSALRRGGWVCRRVAAVRNT